MPRAQQVADAGKEKKSKSKNKDKEQEETEQQEVKEHKKKKGEKAKKHRADLTVGQVVSRLPESKAERKKRKELEKERKRLRAIEKKKKKHVNPITKHFGSDRQLSKAARAQRKTIGTGARPLLNTTTVYRRFRVCHLEPRADQRILQNERVGDPPAEGEEDKRPLMTAKELARLKKKSYEIEDKMKAYNRTQSAAYRKWLYGEKPKKDEKTKLPIPIRSKAEIEARHKVDNKARGEYRKSLGEDLYKPLNTKYRLRVRRSAMDYITATAETIVNSTVSNGMVINNYTNWDKKKTLQWPDCLAAINVNPDLRVALMQTITEFNAEYENNRVERAERLALKNPNRAVEKNEKALELIENNLEAQQNPKKTEKEKDKTSSKKRKRDDDEEEQKKKKEESDEEESSSSSSSDDDEAEKKKEEEQKKKAAEEEDNDESSDKKKKKDKKSSSSKKQKK